MDFIKIQTIFHNGQNLIPGQNPGNFHGQAGMAAKSAPQQHPEPSFPFFNGTRGTGSDTFTAQKAKRLVNYWLFPLLVQTDRPIHTGVHTGRAQGALFLPRPGTNSPNNTDVHYLGAGTGIWAVRQRKSKLMVKFQPPCNICF